MPTVEPVTGTTPPLGWLKLKVTVIGCGARSSAPTSDSGVEILNSGMIVKFCEVSEKNKPLLNHRFIIYRLSDQIESFV